MACQAYILVLFALFTGVRTTFFASGCFGTHCRTTTKAPRLLRPAIPYGGQRATRRTNGLRSLPWPNIDDIDDRIYDRSGSIAGNFKTNAPSALGAPVSVNARVKLCSECAGPSDGQCVGYKPRTKEYIEHRPNRVVYSNGGRWHSKHRDPKVVRWYRVHRHGGKVIDSKGRLGVENKRVSSHFVDY